MSKTKLLGSKLDGIAPRGPNVRFTKFINHGFETSLVVQNHFLVRLLVLHVEDLLEVVFEEFGEVASLASLLIHHKQLFVDYLLLRRVTLIIHLVDRLCHWHHMQYTGNQAFILIVMWLFYFTVWVFVRPLSRVYLNFSFIKLFIFAEDRLQLCSQSITVYRKFVSHDESVKICGELRGEIFAPKLQMNVLAIV